MSVGEVNKLSEILEEEYGIKPCAAAVEVSNNKSDKDYFKDLFQNTRQNFYVPRNIGQEYLRMWKRR